MAGVVEALKDKFANVTDAMTGMDPVTIAFVVAITVAVWWIPTILAVFRNRKNVGKIFILNITVGWTTIGWIALIVWALNPSQSYESIKARFAKKNAQPTNEITS